MSGLRWAVAGAWLMVGLAASCGVRAGTLQEDEARIEALLRAERAAAGVSAMPQSPDGAVVVASSTPVIAEVVAKMAQPSENDEWLAPAIEQTGLPFADLAHYIGQRVSITTAGEREHRGTVKSANARQVTLLVRRSGGNATYTLRREQVQRVDLR
jgi:hypothetical protein